MSAITWPDFPVGTFSWTLEDQSVPFKSVFGSQALVVGSPVWSVRLTGVPMTHDAAGAMQLFLESLSGFKNQIALWNLRRPQPMGTLRGTLTLSGDHAQGATTLVLDGGVGQAGATLVAGDLLGIGSGITQQVVRVNANVTANGSGVISASLGTPLRNAFLSGQAVIWDRPCALFRQREITAPMVYVPGRVEPWSLALLEDWRP